MLIVPFTSVPVEKSPRSMPLSVVAPALSLMALRLRVNPLMLVIRMPSDPGLVMFIYPRLVLAVLFRLTPAPVVFWMVPPEPLLLPPLSPFTVSPPLDPVVFRTMPFVAPLDEMLRNSRLFEPIVVLATLSAVPVVVVSVLTSAPVAAGLHGFSSQTLTVPPPVAVKAALVVVLIASPPLKVTVPLSLLSSKTPSSLPSPSLLSVIAPEKVYVAAEVGVTFWI